jgi:hypothetical protein
LQSFSCGPLFLLLSYSYPQRPFIVIVSDEPFIGSDQYLMRER